MRRCTGVKDGVKVEGWFHGWGSDSYLMEIGIGSERTTGNQWAAVPVAIIEQDDGKCFLCPVREVVFKAPGADPLAYRAGGIVMVHKEG